VPSTQVEGARGGVRAVVEPDKPLIYLLVSQESGAASTKPVEKYADKGCGRRVTGLESALISRMLKN